jgi:hypothetical protein
VKRSPLGAFTFDTKRLEWTYLGEWLLPFKGQAYYNGELDAWVGLCLYKEGVGHLCCCQVPPAAGCKTMPIWKLGLDVFFDAKSKLHTGAALLYKGGSRFCLVECQRSKDYKFNPRLRLLKMASFVLKYDWEAELRTAHHRDHASMSYQVGHDCGYALLNPVAFWM